MLRTIITRLRQGGPYNLLESGAVLWIVVVFAVIAVVACVVTVPFIVVGRLLEALEKTAHG